LQYYTLKKPVTISCDASQAGLGCVLLQDGLPVSYGSKALTTAEYAYAQIEKEMLAIVFALKKFHTYVYGRHDVTIETDHLPLLRILEKPLHQVPLRLQKMRMKIQGYDFKLIHKKGTEIPVADALSRSFIADTGPNLTGDEQCHIFEVSKEEMVNIKQVSPSRLEEIKKETQKDTALQELTWYIKNGWPNSRQEVTPLVKPYYEFQEELCVVDDIIYKGQRIVVPTKMRKDALKVLHSGHQGIVKTKQLTRDLLYWPGVNKEVEELISTCATCQENRNMQAKEPLMPTPVPSRPWEHVAEDLFTCLGHKWLICVDYYSEYFEIERLDAGTHGEEVIRQTKKWFSTHGIPDRVTSDNGPPFNGAQWKDFATTYGFIHTPTSPLHPQANGMVERAVGIAKTMLKKCSASGTDPYLALLNIRNTPRDDQTGSPVQRLFSRRTRTKIPTRSENLNPEVKPPEVVTKRLEEDRHKKAKKYFDNNKTKPLKPVKAGDTIRVRVGNTWQPALLLPMQTTNAPRSYNIRLPSGIETTRNRRHLLRTNEQDIYREDVREEEDMELPSGPPQLRMPTSPARPQLPDNDYQSPVRSPVNTPHTTSTRDNPQSQRNPKTGLIPAQKAPERLRSGRISRAPPTLREFVK
jgi:hypothetical protein